MRARNAELVFYFLITLGVLILSYFIFAPYLTVLFLAVIFAVVFFPVYDRLLNKIKGKGNLASLITVALIIIVILIPLFLIGILLFQETTDIYNSVVISGNGLVWVKNSLIVVEEFFNSIPGLTVDITQFTPKTSTIQNILSWLLNHLNILFSGLLKGALFLFLFVLSLFYLFRDGKNLVTYLIHLSPLTDTYDRKIVNRVGTSVNSVVKGYIVIAIIKGILGGVGFLIFGIGSPVLWGLVTAISSLLPTIGTAIVMLPAAGFLFATGHVGASIGLLIWAIAIVGAIDNVLAPFIIQKGVKLHPLLILLSVLGGIAMFGPIGFIVGPVILSLLFSLLDIYPILVGTPHDHK